ncbi:Abi family protein [Leuconostoc mesenteroides]|uniref:Abi family protein n=1 Tax=Leuconostoc mesenteroides TaxID=1245 RepID=UPI00123C684E|nr:Abi family protein [Leuconostoc mesenteroides]KAA8347093.1 hypothetical protein FE418_08180 [Leuconostoc mesenteroides]
MSRKKIVDIAPYLSKPDQVINRTVVTPMAHITSYREPFSRDNQIDLMQSHHHVLVNKRDDAKEILTKAPYNLLIYEGIKVWFSRSENGKSFQKGTKLEYLYELYKFDSYLKGKLLEIIRPFENMFIGSMSYHFELEYQRAYNMMSKRQKAKTPRHNVGYSGSPENIELIPLWDQFFMDSSMNFKKEIDFWNSLCKNRLIFSKSQPEINYCPVDIAKRMSKNEVQHISNNFRTQTVRTQIIRDIRKFSSIKSDHNWNAKIGASQFGNLLNIIRQFRNESSHPGYILNSQCKACIRGLKTSLEIRDFIELLPYFTPEDIYTDFISSIKSKLFYLHTSSQIPMNHIHKIENKIGIKLL